VRQVRGAAGDAHRNKAKRDYFHCATFELDIAPKRGAVNASSFTMEDFDR
jgi:hypothetical protein